MTVEICSEGIEAARKAVAAGADRIELCVNLPVGGVTPPHEEILEASTLPIPVNVLIRPRGGDFVMSDNELQTILDDIRFCGECHMSPGSAISGVVVGALTPDGEIDMTSSKKMVEEARKFGLTVTYHRAIDVAADTLRAEADVLKLGVDRILTSGGADTAWNGRETIKKMVQAAGNTIILAGSGVSGENAVALVAATGVKEVHGSRTSIIGAFSNKE